ncbi:hypothetical protein D3C73_1311940 [compost metagenome]
MLKVDITIATDQTQALQSYDMLQCDSNEKAVLSMSVNREELKRMIDSITDQEAAEILDFIGYLNLKRERDTLINLEQASITSMGFWDNDLDNEVWNNV